MKYPNHWHSLYSLNCRLQSLERPASSALLPGDRASGTDGSKKLQAQKAGNRYCETHVQSSPPLHAYINGTDADISVQHLQLKGSPVFQTTRLCRILPGLCASLTTILCSPIVSREMVRVLHAECWPIFAAAGGRRQKTPITNVRGRFHLQLERSKSTLFLTKFLMFCCFFIRTRKLGTSP